MRMARKSDAETASAKDPYFWEYFSDWVRLYKDGAVRDVTLKKYKTSLTWVKKLLPDVRLSELDRRVYQGMINEYAKGHELQTTKDFNTHVKACVADAIDDGLILKDPTKKIIMKGSKPREKKIKYLNQYQLHQLIEDLDLSPEPNWDWMILIMAKTGLRFSEALGLTPKDFDFSMQTVSVSKTWDYKNGGGFAPTKNKSSVRKVRIDWQTATQFGNLINGLPEDKPIFVKDGTDVYNSTANAVLERHCMKLGIPTISIHGLRHTHASLLLYAGASIASVARRLGHSNMTTTQKTYLHIIQELENQDVDVMMRAMSAI